MRTIYGCEWKISATVNEWTSYARFCVEAIREIKKKNKGTPICDLRGGAS